MSYAALKVTAKELSDKASFLVEITDNDEYEQALALMNELIDDYDDNKVLVELLSNSIERWEDTSDDFAEFNKRIHSEDHALSFLRVLMDQKKLGVSDLPEIGSKSLVSKILNEHRNLTREHIDALSKRFKVSPAMFFSA